MNAVQTQWFKTLQENLNHGAASETRAFLLLTLAFLTTENLFLSSVLDVNETDRARLARLLTLGFLRFQGNHFEIVATPAGEELATQLRELFSPTSTE